MQPLLSCYRPTTHKHTHTHTYTHICQYLLEHSDSEKKYSDLIRFDFPKRIDFFDSIQFSTSLPYRLLSFTMLSNVNSTSCTALCEIQRRSMGLCHGVSSLIRRMQRPNQTADFFNDSPKTNRRIDSNRESEYSSIYLPRGQLHRNVFTPVCWCVCLLTRWLKKSWINVYEVFWFTGFGRSNNRLEFWE